jgi:hypothetical protein
VLSRIPFDFNKKDYFYMLMGKLSCYRNKKSKSMKKKESLFQSGIDKLGKEFDIAQIATQLRTLSLLSHVILFKY